MYDTILFDLDGTLLDTLDDLSDAVNHTLRQFGYPLRDRMEVRAFIGNGLRRLMELSLPVRLEANDFEAVFLTFRDYYTAHCREKTRAYDGVLPLLAALHGRGCRIAIISNKNDAAVRTLTADYFEGLVDAAVGERDGIRRKPAPDAIRAALRELGGGKAVYIGDSEVDKLTADNAGTDCILVDWGFRDRADLLRLGVPVVSDAAELQALLEAAE